MQAPSAARDHVSLEVSLGISHTDDGLVSTIQKKMEDASSFSNICRVPDELRSRNERYYSPELVSIGPYHRRNQTLGDMENHKLRYLFTLLNRNPDIGLTLDKCVKSLKELENRARQSYEEESGLSSDEFVEMMLIDGCFIIELLIKCSSKTLRRRNDPLFCTPGKLYTLRCDLVLLENQIPLFILQRLFQIVPIPKQCSHSLIDLAFRFFKSMIPGEQEYLREKLSEEAHHLLDLIHHWLIPANYTKKDAPTPKGLNKSAVELQAAGIKFKRSVTKSMLDIEFSKGVLHVPAVRINQSTETLLRNLIALEQQRCIDTQCVTSYAHLIHDLMPSEKDEKLFSERRMVSNYPDSNKRALRLFEDLCKDTIIEDFHYEELGVQMNEYIKRKKCSPLKCDQKTDHSDQLARKPRALVVVAIIVLFMIFIGTLFSALSFFLHHN
ncbi:UPF0481 protein At3g47200 [Eucalyptus grandis]|uniref:UPF0481 protein At3g47200 n=1 Tax=Eucalyptus grandis TaxID=71139 RepID=UPI00192EBF07|nr:UPF0481 protein At3g47200 [Eucalyptus grandis]XP_018725727.2 UPF0481 protein At3g47200 [Eucalyptus grandis]